ncbi:MAG: glycosyltransferase family 39 protein [Planctomycetaceae bacterium]|nr:glycosyltransferase family 39 protein [Planctomycetaceae bacterium]
MRTPSSSSPAVLVERAAAVFTALVVLFVLLRRAIYHGLLGDELLFVHAISLGFPDSLMAAGSSHPPLLRWLVSLLADPRSADWLLRLPSVLFAIACVPVWFLILQRLFDSPVVRGSLLLAISLNEFWLTQAFQCLPYPPLVFFASLHCLAWMRFVAQPQDRWRQTTLVLTGCVLPWTHFFGINVLLATQLIWVYLLWQQQTSLRTFVYINLALVILTIPVVPLAMFYIVHDRPYPLMILDDFAAYFVPGSAYCFTRVTFSGVESFAPLFVLVYAGIAAHLGRTHYGDQTTDTLRRCEHTIVFAFLAAGFTAAQLHALLSQTAMWPRYMLGGSWLHLPVISLLLIGLKWQRTAVAFSTVAAGFAIACLGSTEESSDYDAVVSYIQQQQQPQDAFLAQSMDLWQGDNHFDRLWYERYTDGSLPVVSGLHRSRTRLIQDGLNLTCVDASVDRVWVYSHLFKQAWLRQHPPQGWRLISLQHPGGPFPVALLQRDHGVRISAHDSDFSE